MTSWVITIFVPIIVSLVAIRVMYFFNDTLWKGDK